MENIYEELTSKLNDISENIATLGNEILTKLQEILDKIGETACVSNMQPW